MRVVLGLRKQDSVSQHMKDLEWLSAKNRIYYRTMRLIGSVMMNSSPKYLANHLRQYAPARPLRSQSASSLVARKTRTAAGDKAFRNFAPRLWNELPSTMKDSINKNVLLERLRISLSDE